MDRIDSNFAILQQHDQQLFRLGVLAEKYFAEDPNTCLLKLRQLAELLAQMLAARTGQYSSSEENQFELLRRLKIAVCYRERSFKYSVKSGGQGMLLIMPYPATIDPLSAH